jgi:hypothetical protein
MPAKAENIKLSKKDETATKQKKADELALPAQCLQCFF